MVSRIDATFCAISGAGMAKKTSLVPISTKTARGWLMAECTRVSTWLLVSPPIPRLVTGASGNHSFQIPYSVMLSPSITTRSGGIARTSNCDRRASCTERSNEPLAVSASNRPIPRPKAVLIVRVLIVFGSFFRHTGDTV